jgi:ComF family protein
MNPYIKDFFHLSFPRYCAGCEKPLYFTEKALCVHCLLALPRARMHHERDNAIEKLFWGKADVAMATAFLRMSRKGMAHRLIHELKYDGNKAVGVQLGKLFGAELSRAHDWKTIDLIVPVPLHPLKELERGYNQSAMIAMGMSDTMRVKWRAHALKRNVHTASQTRRSRWERWQNVNDIFSLDREIFNKTSHCLLVDDVITTGATIEACVNAVHQHFECKISVASLARPVR